MRHVEAWAISSRSSRIRTVRRRFRAEGESWSSRSRRLSVASGGSFIRWSSNDGLHPPAPSHPPWQVERPISPKIPSATRTNPA